MANLWANESGAPEGTQPLLPLCCSYSHQQRCSWKRRLPWPLLSLPGPWRWYASRTYRSSCVAQGHQLRQSKLECVGPVFVVSRCKVRLLNVLVLRGLIWFLLTCSDSFYKHTLWYILDITHTFLWVCERRILHYNLETFVGVRQCKNLNSRIWARAAFLILEYLT